MIPKRFLAEINMLESLLLIAGITIGLISIVSIIYACIIGARAEGNYYRSKRFILTDASAPQARRGLYWPRVAFLTVTPCLMLVAALVLRLAAPSLPGNWLYPVKRGGEE